MNDDELNLTEKIKLLGIYVFYNPYYVLSISDYLLSNYCNDPEGTTIEWVEDLILNIIENNINFTILGYFGMASNYSKKEKVVLFLKFFGNELCLIPLEYFYNNNLEKIHQYLDLILKPENECFEINSKGLKGEFFFESFKYKKILDNLFLSSFYIITITRRYIEILIETHKGEETTINFIKKLIEIIKKVLNTKLKEIDESFIKKLLTVMSSNYILSELYINLSNLWTEIAEYSLLKFYETKTKIIVKDDTINFFI